MCFFSLTFFEGYQIDELKNLSLLFGIEYITQTIGMIQRF
jgi:hypothetical protein